MNFSQHAKHPLTLTGKGAVTRLVIFFIVIALFQSNLRAQGKPAAKNSRPALKDTAKTKTDTTKTKKGDIESTIVYSAEDSIISELQSKIVRLYGNAKVTYGQISLDAEEIFIDYEKSTITAHGKKDSTGQLVGYPIFKDGNETYETKGMTYNFKTKKATISEVVTKQGEQILHGERVYKNEKNEIFTINNGFTTCDLADPHYRIISRKAKAITGDKMISGPFYMEFNHVPTPLGFAFGIFPSQRQSQSGIIVPAYGEETIRGFFLRGGGYYFHVSDYLDLRFTGDLYTNGSTALYLNGNYISRYRYSGNFNLSFSNNSFSNKIEVEDSRKDFSITWSHSPRTKGTSRFAASVNAASSTNNTNNLLGMGQANLALIQNSNMQRKASSNISFSKTFAGTPFSLATNMRHSQDFSTRRVDFSLPDISFNVNNIYPFKNSETKILQNFQFKYTMTASNQINNDLGLIAKNSDGTPRDSIGTFNLQNLPIYFQNANKGVKHVIPISTSFKILKYFTVTTSATYNELWYFDKLVWGTQPTNNLSLGTTAVKIDTIHQFNRESYYNLSVGFTSRIYGTHLARRPTARIRAIRHLITPSIGFSYNPDFSDPSYGYYQRVGLTDGNGKPTIALKSIHEGFIYGSSPLGQSQSMSIGIGNTVEMKVRKPKDTVDRKVSLLNNLSLGTSYNFLADSFKLSPISLSANSNILDNKININLGATLDPYQYRYGRFGTDSKDQPVYKEVRVSRYSWDAGQIGRITSASLALSTNLSSKGKKKDADTRDKIAKSNASQADKEYLLKHPDTYIDFSIPWNLRLSYNITYSKTVGPAAVIQSANFSGDVSLSEKWKVTYSAGYDFVHNAITQTSLGLNRDLHCWQMSLNWIPFGKFQSYTFNIGIKSALLKDLKLNRTRSFVDSQQGY